MTDRELNIRKNGQGVWHPAHFLNYKDRFRGRALFIWKEMNTMNELERLHQWAKRYQTEYPPGATIVLLSMGRS